MRASDVFRRYITARELPIGLKLSPKPRHTERQQPIWICHFSIAEGEVIRFSKLLPGQPNHTG
jgi:hypothetical protein